MLALTLVAGCSYEERKALRNYDEALEPVRDTIDELSRYQPRVSEKSAAEKIRGYVTDEILFRSATIIGTINVIEPAGPELEALHEELESIWTAYHDGFEQFVEDMTDENLSRKRRKLSEVLSRCDVRWRTWNAELQSYHERVQGWGAL